MPNIPHKVTEMSDGGKEITFQSLVPNEQITISYLYFPPKTYQQINTYVKSDAGLARIVKIIPALDLAIWQKAIIYFFLFIGCATVIYLLIMFLTFISINYLF